MKDFIKSNKKLIFIAILVFIFGGLTGVVAYSVYANKVTYDNTQSGLQSTDVQGAIDELYTKANNMVPIDPDTFQINRAKTIYASKLGVCIIRNNKLNCFKINNYEEEKDHIQQVFSDISCNVDSTGVNCNASDFNCEINSYGSMYCRDLSDYSDCYVNPGDSGNCS